MPKQPITAMDKQESSVVINQVNVDNFDFFLGLISKLAEYEKLPSPNEEAKGRLRRDCLSDKPKYHAYLAEISGKPVAYVIYFFTYSSFLALPTLFLEDLFVLEEYRGLGVGKKMFAFIKEAAKREGCGRIEFTVLKWNTSAQGFYERNGAECLEWYFYRVVQEDF
jgi:GNAT superfamily N-acetyltransferase